MGEIDIRIQGRAGRITLNRPGALNALTYEMVMAIDAALMDWAEDARVALVVIDAAGDRAFCAGGDIAEMYATGTAGDYAYGRKFWRDEYRMNARLAGFGKPVVTLMQGFTMGGGVGVGCHASHRVVGETSQIAMPECGIGLVPDVGGSMLLARAPGRMGAYFGTTGARMDAGDAITMGFADHFVPEGLWPDLIAELEATGDIAAVAGASAAAPLGATSALRDGIDLQFEPQTLGDVVRSLSASDSDFARDTLKRMGRNAPLSMACTLGMLDELGPEPTITEALEMEYRFTARSMEHGDFLEGIRAAIIDKDKSPKWRHPAPDAVPEEDVARMLAPLGAEGWTEAD